MKLWKFFRRTLSSLAFVLTVLLLSVMGALSLLVVGVCISIIYLIFGFALSLIIAACPTYMFEGLCDQIKKLIHYLEGHKQDVEVSGL